MTARFSARAAGIALIAGLVAASLAGCTANSDDPTEEPTSQSAASADSGAAAQATGQDSDADSTASDAGGDDADDAPAPEPEFHKDGDAADNLPIFTEVVNAVAASEDSASGRAYIDALVDAGFTDTSAMQVTNDRTTIDEPAESMQVSVMIGEECLIGQFGPATGDPVTLVMPRVTEDTCLVGPTAPLD